MPELCPESAAVTPWQVRARRVVARFFFPSTFQSKKDDTLWTVETTRKTHKREWRFLVDAERLAADVLRGGDFSEGSLGRPEPDVEGSVSRHATGGAMHASTAVERRCDALVQRNGGLRVLRHVCAFACMLLCLCGCACASAWHVAQCVQPVSTAVLWVPDRGCRSAALRYGARRRPQRGASYGPHNSGRPVAL